MFSRHRSFRWIEKVNLRVRATCANPPEVKGQKVKDVHVFKVCPGGESIQSKPTGTQKHGKRLRRLVVTREKNRKTNYHSS